MERRYGEGGAQSGQGRRVPEPVFVGSGVLCLFVAGCQSTCGCPVSYVCMWVYVCDEVGYMCDCTIRIRSVIVCMCMHYICVGYSVRLYFQILSLHAHVATLCSSNLHHHVQTFDLHRLPDLVPLQHRVTHFVPWSGCLHKLFTLSPHTGTPKHFQFPAT